MKDFQPKYYYGRFVCQLLPSYCPNSETAFYFSQKLSLTKSCIDPYPPTEIMTFLNSRT